MKRIRKYVLGGCLAAAILLVIGIVLFLGSRWLTASDAARQKIAAETVRLTGGILNYEKLTLHLLPLPHLTALQVDFQIPEKVSLETAALEIYPDWPALVRGAFELQDVVIVRPAARVEMARPTVADGVSAKAFPPGGLQETATMLFAALSRLGPDSKIKVKDGTVDLVRPDKPVLKIERINLRANRYAQMVTLDLSCRSQISGRLKFKGTVNIETRNSDGRFKLDGLNARALLAELPPLAGIGLSDTRLDLEVIYTSQAAEKVQARVACRIPEVRLTRKKESLVLQNAQLKGDIEADAQKLSWDINSFKVGSLDLDLDSEGTLVFGSRTRPATLSLNAVGWHIDVAAVARSFRKLAGDQAWVQTAFNVARAGVLTKTTCRLVARRVDDGWLVPQIRAAGRLDRGLIAIQDAELDLADVSGDVVLENQRVEFKQMRGRLSYGAFDKLDAWIDWHKTATLAVTAPRGTLDLSKFYPWLTGLEGLQHLQEFVYTAEGELALTQIELGGPLTSPSDWKIDIAAGVKEVLITSPQLGGPLHLSQGSAEFKSRELELKQVHAKYLDADMIISGKIIGDPGDPELLQLSLDGTAGEETLTWCRQWIKVPEYLRVKAPLKITGMNLQWDAQPQVTVKGAITTAGGVRLMTDAAFAPEHWQISRLELNDDSSHAFFKLIRAGQRVDLDYTGKLHKTTLDRIFNQNQILNGWIEGKLQASVDMRNLSASRLTGMLQGAGLVVPGPSKVPIEFQRFVLDGQGETVSLQAAELTVGGTPMHLRGTAGAGPRRSLTFDLDLAAESLDGALLKTIWETPTSRGVQPEARMKAELPIEGVVRFTTQRFTFKEYTWSPLDATITVQAENTKVAVTRADICGIATPGTIIYKAGEWNLAFKPAAKMKNLQTAWQCLQSRPLQADSVFNLIGNVASKGEPADLITNLRGDLSFSSDDGSIHRANILTKIFSLLNITEIFAGKTSGLGEKGFGYDAIRAHAAIKAGMLDFDNILLDGHAMKISGKGTVNLVDEMVDLTLLVAPLKTIDRLVKQVPVVGYITGGSILSVPVRIRGSASDPSVVLLPPAAVGRGLVGILERTLKVPLKVVEYLPGVNLPKEQPADSQTGETQP